MIKYILIPIAVIAAVVGLCYLTVALICLIIRKIENREL